MGALEELGETVRSVTAAVRPAVVVVGRNGRGSGVVIGEGQVLTNAHNLRGGETTVTFADGRRATAVVAGIDVDGDLAVLAVDTAGARPLQWSSDEAGLQAGDVVVAAAGRRGQGVRVTAGMVSATDRPFRGPRGRLITGSVEHTAPLARGSSGGPLLDRSGRLVGINTNRLSEGFYLAQPADADLRARVEALAAGRSTHAVTLGVGLAPARVARRLQRAVGLPQRDGLLVRMVVDASPAAAAGMREGDLIVAAAGREVAEVDQLHEVLAGLSEGRSLALTVVRGAEELELRVTFGPTTEEGAA
ncbi:MAG: S1C family serine protease [Acidimicrobiales bacterium]